MAVIQSRFNQQPLHYQQWMNEISNNRFENPELNIRLCMKLQHKSQKEGNQYVKAFSLLYLSDAHLVKGDWPLCIKTGLKALSLQKEGQYQELLIKQYNVLGIAYMNQSQELYAIDHFKSGLAIAKETNDYVYAGYILNNIGVLYSMMEDYRRAIEYYTLGHKYLRRSYNEQHLGQMHEGAWNINLADVYAEWGKIKYARRYIERAKKYFPDDESKWENTSIQVILTVLNYKCGDYEKALNHSQLALKYIQKITRKLIYYRNANRILQVIVEISQKDIEPLLREKACHMVEVWIEECYQMAQQIALPEQWMLYYNTIITYYKATKNEEKLYDALLQYHHWSKLQNEILRQNRISSLQNRIAFDEAQREKEAFRKKNERLKVLSEVDSLSGAKNRYALNLYFEEKYQVAIDKRQTLGIIIIDIDFFKEYNDTYGHLAGDECISKISNVILNAVGEDGLVVRYGGDEFFIVFIGRTDTEVQECAAKVRDEVKNMRLEHKSSKISKYVTVTQGAINCIPEQNRKVSEYVKSADIALYRVKTSTRNDICFSDSLLI